jgi:hypothetical protein
LGREQQAIDDATKKDKGREIAELHSQYRSLIVPEKRPKDMSVNEFMAAQNAVKLEKKKIEDKIYRLRMEINKIDKNPSIE